MPLSEPRLDAVAALYARTLLDLALRQGGRRQAEEIADELQTIVELSRTDARFREFLASRVLPAAARGESLTRIFGGRVCDLTLRFLQVLNARGRLYHLPAIVSAYDALFQERFERVEVDLFTAGPLPSEDLAGIHRRLAEVLRHEIVLHHYVEPAMIGGIRIQIGDRLIDGSLATQLRRAWEHLRTHGLAALRARVDALVENGTAEAS